MCRTPVQSTGKVMTLVFYISGIIPKSSQKNARGYALTRSFCCVALAYTLNHKGVSPCPFTGLCGCPCGCVALAYTLNHKGVSPCPLMGLCGCPCGCVALAYTLNHKGVSPCPLMGLWCRLSKKENTTIKWCSCMVALYYFFGVRPISIAFFCICLHTRTTLEESIPKYVPIALYP